MQRFWARQQGDRQVNGIPSTISTVVIEGSIVLWSLNQRLRDFGIGCIVRFIQLTEAILMKVLEFFTREMSVHYCSFCAQSIDTEIGKPYEHQIRMGWCPNCKNAFPVPLLKIPGWVLGIMLLLVARLPWA